MLEKSDSLDLVIQVCDIVHGQRQQFVVCLLSPFLDTPTSSTSGTSPSSTHGESHIAMYDAYMTDLSSHILVELTPSSTVSTHHQNEEVQGQE